MEICQYLKKHNEGSKIDGLVKTTVKGIDGDLFVFKKAQWRV
jgi:hypothetical protein